MLFAETSETSAVEDARIVLVAIRQRFIIAPVRSVWFFSVNIAMFNIAVTRNMFGNCS